MNLKNVKERGNNLYNVYLILGTSNTKVIIASCCEASALSFWNVKTGNEPIQSYTKLEGVTSDHEGVIFPTD